MNTNNNNNSNTPPTPTDVSGWSIDQVVAWASGKFSTQTVQKLQDQEVSGNSLLTLTYDKLTNPPFNIPGGPAQEIVNFAVKLQSAPSIPPVPSGPSSVPGTGPYVSKEEQEKTKLLVHRYFEKDIPHISELLLCCLYQTKMPLPETKTFGYYASTSQYTKPDKLPYLPGSVNVLCPSLLSGHLGDPECKPPPLVELLDAVRSEEGQREANTHVLVGPSGCGKTNTAMQFLSERFGLYMDMSYSSRIGDQIYFYQAIDAIVRQDSFDQRECVAEVNYLIATRLVVLLMYIISKLNFTPAQWLHLQLNGIHTRFLAVQREIRKLATDAISIYSLTLDLLGVLKKVVGYRIAIILDEAHTMVHLHSNKFVAASFVEGGNTNKETVESMSLDSLLSIPKSGFDATMEDKEGFDEVGINHDNINNINQSVIPANAKRSLFSFMVHSIACLSEAVLIIAGTALSMADSVELISLIAKVSERPSQCKLHVNWLSWDSRDLEILFNNLLELDKLKHAIGEEYYETLKQRVVGRVRFGLSIVERLLTEGLIVEKQVRFVIDCWLNTLIGSSTPEFTIRASIDKLQSKGVSVANTLLAELLIAAKAYAGIIGQAVGRREDSTPLTIDPLAFGLCTLKQVCKNITLASPSRTIPSSQSKLQPITVYYLAEPLVVEALEKYFLDNQISPTSTHFLPKVASTASAASKGDLLDVVVGVAMWELSLRGTTLKVLLENVGPSGVLPANFDTPIVAKMVIGSGHREKVAVFDRMQQISAIDFIDQCLKKDPIYRHSFLIPPAHDMNSETNLDGVLVLDDAKVILVFGNKFSTDICVDLAAVQKNIGTTKLSNIPAGWILVRFHIVVYGPPLHIKEDKYAAGWRKISNTEYVCNIYYEKLNCILPKSLAEAFVQETHVGKRV